MSRSKVGDFVLSAHMLPFHSFTSRLRVQFYFPNIAPVTNIYFSTVKVDGAIGASSYHCVFSYARPARSAPITKAGTAIVTTPKAFRDGGSVL